jgi:hypothetical protein
MGSIVLVTLIFALQWFTFQSIREEYGLSYSTKSTERIISEILPLKDPVETK